MRIYLLLLLGALLPYLGQAQHRVTGKIVDELGLPIYLAAITMEGYESPIYTNYDGEFEVQSDQNFHWKLTVSHEGYKPASLFVLSGGHAGEIVMEYNAAMNAILNETSKSNELQAPSNKADEQTGVPKT
ncbi:MAG: carboxypeptidase-like regulatory domain-containing protein [Bacteroidota bacterium]